MPTEEEVSKREWLYSEEQRKYIRQKILERFFHEESNPVTQYIELNIKDDKRFDKDINDQIRRELYKRVHELKYHIFKKMKKMQRSKIVTICD